MIIQIQLNGCPILRPVMCQSLLTALRHNIYHHYHNMYSTTQLSASNSVNDTKQALQLADRNVSDTANNTEALLFISLTVYHRISCIKHC